MEYVVIEIFHITVSLCYGNRSSHAVCNCLETIGCTYDIRLQHFCKSEKRIVRKNKMNILVLAGKFCVFSNVHNVYAQDLALLRLPGKDSKDSYANRAINWWNEMRMNNGVLPPPCWPTNVFFLIFMMLVMIYTIAKGYSRIMQMKNYKKPNPLILKTSNDTIEDDRCHSFDSDSDVIIVDNAANCIVWKDKKSFVPGTYILLK